MTEVHVRNPTGRIKQALSVGISFRIYMNMAFRMCGQYMRSDPQTCFGDFGNFIMLAAALMLRCTIPPQEYNYTLT